jgi:hypothetical protein
MLDVIVCGLLLALALVLGTLFFVLPGFESEQPETGMSDLPHAGEQPAPSRRRSGPSISQPQLPRPAT